MTTMNAILLRLTLPPVAPPPPPPRNTYRSYLAVSLYGTGLAYLQNLVDVDIQKFLYEFEDEDTQGLTVELVYNVNGLLPDEPANVVMNGREYDRLLFYVEDRLRRMDVSKRSLLAVIPVQELYDALKALHQELINYTEVVPANLYQS